MGSEEGLICTGGGRGRNVKRRRFPSETRVLGGMETR
jgi:hypothetical protein